MSKFVCSRCYINGCHQKSEELGAYHAIILTFETETFSYYYYPLEFDYFKKKEVAGLLKFMQKIFAAIQILPKNNQTLILYRTLYCMIDCNFCVVNLNF